ncbi:hypothetical protein [Nocardioides sp. SYSU D00038]|uniref:hypothetical protein n=1 Tax=Nocardioides sp. SYSU D00038 TaxID=2812554 RepID=UPI0019688A7B|nr:hypothetical protein [Nocardioides sp. SYSU D00038]
MKRAVLAAGVLLLAGAAGACGDDGGGGGDAGGSPTDASEKDFCAAFTDLSQSASGSGEDTEAAIEKVKDAAEKLADVGTPEGMPDDARKGFELFLEAIDEVDADASEEDLQDLGNDLSDEENDSVDAFVKYASETCVSAG